jgi:hypothetical protein
MGEILDPTWVACWSRAPLERSRLDAGVERVRSHYAGVVEGGLEATLVSGSHVALACAEAAGRSCRWPAIAAAGDGAIASAYAPTGADRLGGTPAAVAAAVAEDPERVVRTLDPPCAFALAEPAAERVTIVNDCLGAGRAFELARDDVRVWSNRPGAIPLFLGEPAAADEEAWGLFAAMGWFIRDATPFRGVRRLPRGVVVRATPAGCESTATDAVGELVGRGSDLGEGIERFVAEATGVARGLVELFPERPRVDLSGGRDSRLSAAFFVAAGAAADFVTSDMTPGEADVAAELMRRAGRAGDHQVRWAGEREKVYDRGLRERARAVHLVHDGMRHASKVRGKQALPFALAPHAEVSGHGGEIAHGFYYTTPRALAKLGGGDEAVAERLAQAARRRHHAATDRAYARGREAVAATLGEGRGLGVEGPALLDWFYLAERFSHRSGLAADTQRFTFFACQGFLRAAFALTPEERLADRLHRDLTARLVPAWADVPYFAAERPKGVVARLRRRRHRSEKRPMIWEGEDGAELEEMIAAEGAWTSMYEPARVRELLAQCRAGRPDSHFQDPFEGIAFRMAFDDHLALLGERAAAGESLLAPDR